MNRRLDSVDLRYSNGFAVRVPGLKPDAPAAPNPARRAG